jgi:tetratricopeptide (TPR) repeat protein
MNANEIHTSAADAVSEGRTEPVFQPRPFAIENGPATAPWWKRDWFFGLLLLIATFLTYQPAWHGEPVYDDDDHLTPPELQSVSGLVRIWTQLGVVSQYYPIAHSAFWLEHKLWGESMLGYHLANIFLHVACALMLARVLKRLDIPGAWLAAAIFALHPVEVESVAWISELKNTLSTLFYLGAALTYLNFDGARRKIFYGAALALFVLGLLSKSVMASLPAALLLVFWWKRGKLSWRNDVLPLVPFFAIAAASGILTAWIERRFIGASGETFHLSLIQRCLIAGRAVWFYLGKLFCPANLTFIYPRWQVSESVWWQYLFPAALLLLLAGLWSVRNYSRAPLASLLFFVGTLFPALGFLNVYPFRYSFVADHYQYLASIGLIVLVAAAVAGIQKRFTVTPATGVARRTFEAGLCAFLLLIAICSWRQSRMYAGIETLWRATLAGNPSCWVAHSNLGNYLLDRGRVDEALEHSRAAVRLAPDAAEVHNNLGNALREKGLLADAISEYREAVRLHPRLVQAQFNLGAIFLERSQLNDAMFYFENAARLRPDYVKAQNNLGDILLRKGRVDEALAHIEKAFEVRPDDPEVLINFGNALLRKGRADEALVRYRRALELAPESELAHYNLGCALLQQGKLDEAIAQFEKAIALKDDFFQAHFFLGNAWLQHSNAPAALAALRSAVKVDPNNPDALAVLAWTLATWPEAAVRNGTEALELARRADQLTDNRNPLALRALAAATAEVGQFNKAGAFAEQALKLAGAQHDAALVEALKAEAKFYEAGSPFRQP